MFTTKTTQSRLITTFFLGSFLLSCSSEETVPNNNTIKTGTTTENPSEPTQDKFNQKKFKIVKLKTNKTPIIPEVQFNLTPKNDNCTYQVIAQPFKYFSNSLLKKNKLNPEWSPIRILENDKPLQVNMKKNEFEGKECIGAFYSTGNTITYSPTSDAIKGTDLTLALDSDIPVITAKGPVYWLYKDLVYTGKIRREAIGDAKTVTLNIAIKSFGKITRQPKLAINDKPYEFTENPSKITATIPIANDDTPIRFRIRFFNYAMIDEISLSTETTSVYLIKPHGG